MAAGEKISVMIVDDVAETRENIRKILTFEADFDVTAMARSGREAIELAQELKPDVILMDINMQDMDGITATETIHRKVPYIQIIILSVQGDPNYMRRAMVAGAHDFLTKPPVIDELITAIRRGGNVAHEERTKMASSSLTQTAHAGTSSTVLTSKNGKVIVVYSPKGGTGTTTIATNLAICLHSEETKTALVDASLQFGDVAVFLNEQGKNTIFDLTSRADELDPDIVEEVMITHPASGVHVLAAPSKPELAENVDGDQFSKVLQFLRQLYSYIVIDTSSYLNDVVLAALDVADLVIVITTQEIPAVKNVKLFLSLLDAMQIERRRIIFAMNRYDKRIALLPEKIAESLKQTIAAVIPLDERTVIPSVNRGIPFIMDNKTQPIGKSILSLAELVREAVMKPEEDVLEKVIKR